jgi:16S rRNA (guanine1516-N2)-methyltransferase
MPFRTDTSPRIGVGYTAPEQQNRAEKLAAQLGLPMAAEGTNYDFILRCTDERIELVRLNDPALTGSVWVEFTLGPTGYRRIRGGSEMLIRAIGHKKNRKTSVLDATGGLGRDTFIMAAHGCDVHIVEKNPIVAALLEDGLRRASEHPDTKEICARIQLTVGDSCHLLSKESRTGKYDVIYLDPMFPERSKSARVKKDLQVLQLIVEGKSNTDTLFTAALKAAGKRVVIKRPKNAPPLPGKIPSHSISSKAIRFDVYLV